MAAPGPSLALAVEKVACSGLPTIVVQDAWRLLPAAEVLYGCEGAWWQLYKGVPEFKGEKWASHSAHEGVADDKRQESRDYKLHLIAGDTAEGFSFDPSRIHYGDNSGFQAVNLALLFGCTHIILVGFDMRRVDGRAHFFGEHPQQLNRGTQYERFAKHFERSAKLLPAGIRIINATPGSALTCFPMMDLDDAFRDRDLHCNGAVTHAAAG